jgi:hypothetical protein
MRRQSGEAAREADVRPLVVSLLAATGSYRRVADAADADVQLEIEARAVGGLASSFYDTLAKKEPSRERRSSIAVAIAKRSLGEPVDA